MKQTICTYCKQTGHTSISCYTKAKTRIKPISTKTLNKKQITDRQWYELNPPDSRGCWYCYLNISPECPRKLTRSSLTLEHVRSKVRAPELKYDVTNIKPACSFCNALKGSKDIAELNIGEYK